MILPRENVEDVGELVQPLDSVITGEASGCGQMLGCGEIDIWRAGFDINARA